MRLALALLALAATARAEETSRLSEAQIYCTFRHPLEVGASVTARVMAIPGLEWAEKTYFGLSSPAHYGGSPSLDFLSHYRRMEPKFHRFSIPTEEHDVTNLSKMNPQDLADVGTGQVVQLMEGDHRDAFQKASIVVGFDLFYWDAIWNECGYGFPRYLTLRTHSRGRYTTRTDTEFRVQQLIEEAKKQGKILVLSNIPTENRYHVMIDTDRVGGPPLWFPQNPACVASINATMDRLCHVEDGCYLVDGAKAALTLNNGGKLKLRDGTEIGLYEARPDGVHFSNLGARYMAEQMENLFEAHPPACKDGAASPAESGGAPENAGGAQ